MVQRVKDPCCGTGSIPGLGTTCLGCGHKEKGKEYRITFILTDSYVGFVCYFIVLLTWGQPKNNNGKVSAQ